MGYHFRASAKPLSRNTGSETFRFISLNGRDSHPAAVAQVSRMGSGSDKRALSLARSLIPAEIN